MSAPTLAAPADAATPPAPPVPWRALGRVGLAVLAVLTAFGALLPVFPRWVGALAQSDTQVGLATTVATGVGLLLGRPLAARLMEGRARLPTLRLGAILCAATCALFPFAGALAVVLGLRLVLGVGFALVTTAGIALVTDLSPVARRGQILGYYGAGNALSLVVGPVLGGLLRGLGGFDAVFFGAALLALCAPLAVRGFEEPERGEGGATGSLWAVFALRPMRWLVPAHGLAMALHGAMVVLLPLRLAERSGAASPELFFALDAAAVVGLRVLVGRRFDTLGRRVFIFSGLALLAAGGLVVSHGFSGPVVALAAVLYGLGFGAYVPGMHALVGDALPPSHRVRGFALYFLAFDLALACGGVALGPVADHFDRGVALAAAALTPILALGVLLFAGRRLDPPNPTP